MLPTWRRKADSVWGYDNVWNIGEPAQRSKYMSRIWQRNFNNSADIAGAIYLVVTLAILAAFVVLVFGSSRAHAQAGVAETVSIVTTSNVSGAGSCTGGGCTATNVATIKVNQYRKSLTFDNTGNSINVGFCFGTCTAAIGVGGTQTLAAGTNAFWPAGSAPNAAIVFISASGTPAVTVREGK